MPDPFPRPMIAFLHRTFGDTPVVGAETGVMEGQNAESILRTLRIKSPSLIDPYRPYQSLAKAKQRNLHNAKRQAIRRLSSYPQIRWILQTSQQAAPKIPNGLDFVNIGGDHEEESVRSDLEVYCLKVRIGGFIGGHDYLNLDDPGNRIFVKKAGDTFAAQFAVSVAVGNKSRQWPDCLVRKQSELTFQRE